MAGADRDVRQVLRYWLGALRFEESLASRPRAHRPDDTTTTSQSYFRLGADHAAFFTSMRGEAGALMDPALERFLDHWLRRVLRQRAARSEAEITQGTWIAGWPAVFFARRDEIATLFRFPVDVEWRLGGAPWDPLTAANRRARPDVVVVRASESDEGEAPVLSIDRHLLNTTLGLLDDEIADLEAAWRASPEPAAIIAALLRQLAPEIGSPGSPAETFRAVVQAVSRRLPPGVSVYPTGIVQDGALVFATHQLQRELVELLSLRQAEAPLRPGTALWSYLTGAPSDPDRGPLRGRFRSRGVSASQRAAAELALGSRLSAVQGPPGTGKTELILSLAAHALVERIDGWERGRPMNGGLLVVASTNNRAVDNAIDPIGAQIGDDRLPLALRSGNQEVTRTITVRELNRAITWLTAQSDAGAHEHLAQAREAFRGAREALSELTATREDGMRREARLRAIRRELAELPPPQDEDDGDLHGRLLALRAAVEKLEKSTRSRKRKIKHVEHAWVAIAAELVAPLRPLRPELAKGLPCPPGASRTEWREALGDLLEDLEDELRPQEEQRRAARIRAKLQQELAELEAMPAEPALDAATELEIEVRAHALFLRAQEARERWAVANRDALLTELHAAAKTAASLRSLRSMFQGESSGRGLRALYPVIGCTLLSLANVFQHAPNEIELLVIDEAGQCHPAYPVAGLGRARRALLIGDVSQLPPVVTISRRDEARIRHAARVDLAGDERFAPFVIHDRAGTSAQALADRAVHERPTLTDHFRCQRQIIALSDALCSYGLVVHTPTRSLSATHARLSSPVLFHDVPGAQVRARGSWANQAEAEQLAELVVEMRAAGIRLSEIGVLTPYVGQLELLRQLLRRRHVPLEEGREDVDATRPALPGFGVPDVLSIGTVHRFQGGERSVILLSTTITRAEDLTFIDERVNLLNVAISRARDHLVTFGREDVLRAGRHTRILVERAARLT